MRLKEIIALSETPKSYDKALYNKELDYIWSVTPDKESKASLHLKVINMSTKNETVWMHISRKQLKEIQRILTRG